MKRAKGNTHIFTLLDTPAMGGAEWYLLSLIEYAIELGYSLTVATNNDHVAHIYSEYFKDRGITSVSLIKAPYRLDFIGNYKGLIKYFFAAPPALLWCYQTLQKLQNNYEQVICLFPGFSDRLTFSPLVTALTTPLIWIEIGPLEPTFKKNWGFPKLMYSLTKNLPSHFISTSKWTIQSMHKNASIAKKNITLVYPSTQTFSKSELDSLRKAGRKWKQKNSLESHKIITYVGRLASENEVELVIEAYATLIKTNPTVSKKWKLVVIGDGPSKALLMDKAAELQVNDHTHFTGFITQERKQSIVAASDIFTFTRAWELDGFGMTTIEAMALGVPVITTDFGPQREIVNHRKNGLLFKPHSAESLAKQLEVMMRDLKLRKRLGSAGKKFVQKTFNRDTVLKPLAEVLQSYSK